MPQAVGRIGWSIADQALISLANFALSAIVARTMGPTDFGAFTIAFTAYLLTLAISRSVATQPLLIRYSGTSQTEWRRGTSQAAGTVVVVGIGGGLACLAAGSLAEGALREALITVGFMMPGLMLWDIWRYAFFAAARGKSAFVIDAVLVAVLLAALAAIALFRGASVVWPTLAWGASAAAVGVVGSAHAGVLPRPLLAWTWWREQRDIALRYLLEAATESTATLMTYNGIAFIAGLAAVGTLRGAQLIFGPLNILFQGLNLVAIAEGVRLLKSSGRRLRDACLLLSAALVGATLVWGSAISAIPDSLGVLLLGPTWGPARSVLLPAILGLVAIGLIVPAWVGLRALGAASQSLRVRIISSPVTLLCGVGGAALLGVQGAAWGIAIGTGFGAALSWRQFLATLSEYGMSESGRAPSGVVRSSD